MSDKQTNEAPAGPPPPPPPPENPTSKVSPFVLKLRSAPPGNFFQPENPSQKYPSTAPTGPYFFYGTLSDPALLRDVLGLESEPQLRPASVMGYKCKLWGQYPALLDAPGLVVHGAVYHVQTKKHAERLAGYETSNYRADPCRINYTDSNEPREEFGHTFKFVGNMNDLKEGDFVLGAWLKNVKR
ncbi:hypothetical protein BDW62DRAFT_195400 [Aspergillus aurantiobrunneus]